MNNHIDTAFVRFSVFSLLLKADQRGLLSSEFLPPDTPCQEGGANNPRLRAAIEQLEKWRSNPAFRFTLPLQPAGTDFQKRVWERLEAIPAGETRTYGELAKKLVSSPRAIGQACAANPLPVFIPCHRVVAARSMGGFAHQQPLKDGDMGDSRQIFLLHAKHYLLEREADAHGRETTIRTANTLPTTQKNNS